MKVKIPFIFTCIFDLEEMMENVREPSEYILRNGLFPIFVQDERTVKNKENRRCKCWCRSAKNQSVQDRKSVPLDGDQTIESKFDVDRTNGFR